MLVLYCWRIARAATLAASPARPYHALGRVVRRAARTHLHTTHRGASWVWRSTVACALVGVPALTVPLLPPLQTAWGVPGWGALPLGRAGGSGGPAGLSGALLAGGETVPPVQVPESGALWVLWTSLVALAVARGRW